MVQLSHLYMTTENKQTNTALIMQTFVGKVMSLLFNMLSRFVISFLPRGECFLIFWQLSPSAVILEPNKRKSVTVSNFFPSIFHEVMGLGAVIFIFWMLSFKLAFSLSYFTFIKRIFNSSSCHKGGVICISEVIYISLSYLDSSLCFIQPGISHDVLCI